MRNVIEQKVLAGETDEQIIAYFVERFGGGSWRTAQVRLHADAVVGTGRDGAVGLVIVLLFLRERTARTAAAAATSGGGAALDPELERLARETLAATDAGMGTAVGTDVADTRTIGAKRADTR